MESEGISEIKHTCLKPGCGKEANLACPTCIKLNLPTSRFCGQECFKEFWSQHKLVHKSPTALPPEFNSFMFTGSLRPCMKSPRREVPDEIDKPDYASHPKGVPLSEQRDRRDNNSIKIYSQEDIMKMRQVCRLGREILDIGGLAVKAGVTTDEIDRIVHEATIARNAYPSPLNYHQFPKSVCTSVNEVICHGIPDFRPLQDGDIVNVDVSVYKDGYHADLNETFFVGKVDKTSIDLVECAFKALAAAVDICKPGTMYREAGEVITAVANRYKFSVNTTYCGHGVGELFHTAPTIPHYAGNKAKGSMKPGHIFTIEPMINVGHSSDRLWPDNWTSTTVDGTRSSQFEHTILITESGCELLTARPGEPLDKMIWNQESFQR